MLWELKLDFALVLLAMAMGVYMEFILGLAGLGGAVRLGARGVQGMTRAAGWTRAVLLSLDDAIQMVRMAGGRGKGTAAGDDGDDGNAGARDQAEQLHPRRSPGWSDRISLGLGAASLLSLLAAPLLPDLDAAGVAGGLLSFFLLALVFSPAAVGAGSGEELWRAERPSSSAWSTPLVVEVEGQAQVAAAAEQSVKGYDLHSGEEIWETEGLTGNVVPSPVSDGKLVFAMSGFRGAVLRAIGLGRTGKLAEGEGVAWTASEAPPTCPRPFSTRGGSWTWDIGWRAPGEWCFHGEKSWLANPVAERAECRL